MHPNTHAAWETIWSQGFSSVCVITWYFILFLYISGFWTVWFLAVFSKIMLTHHQKKSSTGFLFHSNFAANQILSYNFHLYCFVCMYAALTFTFWHFDDDDFASHRVRARIPVWRPQRPSDFVFVDFEILLVGTWHFAIVWPIYGGH